jgi:hypothetical protein
MSLPNEFDFGLLKVGDGESPEVFTAVCGIIDVAVNETADTTARRVRDCATPNKPGVTKIKVNGTSWAITASGLTNAAEETGLRALLGKLNNYKVEAYDDDGTDAGDLLGTWSGAAVLTAKNINVNRDSDSALELTLEGDGALTWTAA